MKYSVGYKISRNNGLVNKIIECKESISEVYFSWGGFPNGRNNQLKTDGFTPWQAQQKQMEDLKILNENGLKFNLLFNAMCYGAESQSRAFFEKIGETADFIKSEFNLKSVTVTSPLIARFIKDNFSDIDVRASVNMSIGTVEGMDYVKDYFDSFYLKRELNRDFNAVKKLKDWCGKNGKSLYALANSGCLNNCSAHVFHDNLVAHESEISSRDNGYEFDGICKKYLKNAKNAEKLFDITNFIRPEDVYLYEGLVSSLKLATRVSANPLAIIGAYINDGKYSGNVLDLLEPNHSAVFYPKIIDNAKIISRTENGRLIYENTGGATVNLENIGQNFLEYE